MLRSMGRSPGVLVWVACLLAGCGADSTPVVDGGLWAEDAWVPDAPILPVDGGTPDTGSDAGPTDAGPRICAPPPACDAPAPDPGSTQSWRHSIATPITTASGSARHRGRDLFLLPGDDQWALAKFAYGFADDDLEDEDVDLWLLRGCSTWEFLGSGTTTNDGDHVTVEGVEDSGGWVYYAIPAFRRLDPGWHRIRFVVRGDHTTADQYVHVLTPGTRIAVTDVDGTLTESETAEWTAVFDSTAMIAAQPGSPEALWALANRGYALFYLTARPEWLAARTHEWLAERGFPLGIAHTTLSFTGALGGSAVTFKSTEIGDLTARLGYPLDYGIGNTDSDAEAYRAAGIAADHRLLYQLSGDAMGGTVFADYRALERLFEGLPPACP